MKKQRIHKPDHFSSFLLALLCLKTSVFFWRTRLVFWKVTDVHEVLLAILSSICKQVSHVYFQTCIFQNCFTQSGNLQFSLLYSEWNDNFDDTISFGWKPAAFVSAQPPVQRFIKQNRKCRCNRGLKDDPQCDAWNKSSSWLSSGFQTKVEKSRERGRGGRRSDRKWE